ncbi:hypothetical protein ACFTZB_19915 [Rhodococcus sp. NPDC057014]|uniref:hypothetical protein n=1 Tax=Rhodococcus sp. NPDC057014 TaxID=3346000 RepID=UPI00363CBC16
MPVIHQFRPRDRPSRGDGALLRLHRAVAEIEENRRLAWEVAELRRVNQVPRRRARLALRRSTRPGEGHEFH